jgi:hypothetical protein
LLGGATSIAGSGLQIKFAIFADFGVYRIVIRARWAIHI